MLPTEAVVTTDHAEIKRWAKRRRARPVRAFLTGDVRLDLPADDPVEPERPVGWDEWFDTFEDRKLAFLYFARVADDVVPSHRELVARAA